MIECKRTRACVSVSEEIAAIVLWDCVCVFEYVSECERSFVCFPNRSQTGTCSGPLHPMRTTWLRSRS